MTTREKIRQAIRAKLPDLKAEMSRVDVNLGLEMESVLLDSIARVLANAVMKKLEESPEPKGTT